MQHIKATKRGLTAKVAVIYADDGALHSAMLSGNSLWSAGQRCWQKPLQREGTTLHISWPIAEQIAEIVAARDAKRP